MLEIPLCPFCIIVFLLGLIIGSFINCIIYRLHIKKSFLHGRSFCPHCQKQINWYDNIPLVSYLILRGKCRWCKKSISIQYPIVELITGILFLIVFVATIGQWGDGTMESLLNYSIVPLLVLFRNFIFTGVLLIIFLYDFKYYLILDKVSIPAIVVALALNITINLISTQHSIFNYVGQYLLAGAVCGGFFLLQFLISKGKWIGGGDIRLGFLMGIMLGWPHVLAAIFLAYIGGSIIGLALIATKQASMKSQIPFGTFLAISTFVVLLWGSGIIEWYLNFTF